MKTYSVNAFHLTDKLKLKEIGPLISEAPPLLLSVWEAVFKFSEDSYVFLYNFGSVVFFNVSEEKQKIILDKVKGATVTDQVSYTTTDTFSVEVTSEAKTEAGFNKATVKDLNYNNIRLVCMVVAESAALEYFELIVEDLLVGTRQFSESLRSKGRLIREGKQVVKFIGFCLTTKQDIIANLYVVDAPDEVWDDQVLDRLYGDLKRMFEIETRYRVLEYKLKLIQESLEIIVDLSQGLKETYMDLTIIVLIVIDIVIAMVGGKIL